MSQFFVNSAGGGGLVPIETINGDVGSITGSNVTIYAHNSSVNSGATVKFVNSGTISTLNVTDSNGNTHIGLNAGNLTISGEDCTSLGNGAGQSLTNATGNTLIGWEAGNLLTMGGDNVCLGSATGDGITTGGYNTIIGTTSGSNYTSSEDSNIILGAFVTGTLGESNVIRIGAQGTGHALQNKCFISGIINVTNTNAQLVTINSSTTQMGVVASVNNAVITTGVSGIPVATPLNADGQLIIGSGSGAPIPTTLTAGTGITITNAANSITISSNGLQKLSYTNVSVSPYPVLTTDEYLGVDTSTIAITIQLPNGPSVGRVFIIKDKSGNSVARNITVTTVGGAVNIDGATSYVMNTNYESIQVIFNGVSYEIF